MIRRDRSSRFMVLLAVGPLWACAAQRPGTTASAAPYLGSVTAESARRARAVIDEAVRASGGAARLAAIEDISFTLVGEKVLIDQSARPEPPFQREPTRTRLVADLKHQRYLRENEDRYPTGFLFHYRSVLGGRRVWWMDVERNHLTGEQRDLAAAQVALSAWRFQQELVPLLVRSAGDSPDALRSLGEEREGDRRFHLVAFASRGGQRTLWFDADTHLLARVEQVSEGTVAGDSVERVDYSDYHEVGGVQVPGRRVRRINGEVERDERIEAALDARPSDAVFAPPGSAATPGPESAYKPEAMRKLGEGVWLLELLPGGNLMLAVEMVDHLIVLEAPNGQEGSEAAIKLLEKQLPAKPIRYLALTHHHDDHAGGLRPFVARGVPIVTTPGNVAFVRRIAAAPHVLYPDALARAPREPVIETVRGSRVFSDGKNSVELHDLGPNSHTAEYLVAYLPGARVLFPGDAFIVSPDGGPVPAGAPLTGEVLKLVDARGWAVDTVAPVHGRPGTLAEMREHWARWQERSEKR